MFPSLGVSCGSIYIFQDCWDSVGSRSSLKRAARSIARTGSFLVVVLCVFLSAPFSKIIFPCCFLVFGSFWGSQEQSFLYFVC